jgi:hypothetical protein
MEARRPAPDNIAELLATAREEWEASQVTADRVIAALVAALDLMRERRKAKVFNLRVESDGGA